tara:strand:+ start:3736 stop:4038 length:303 start_codon:yes stop_codon:yes gene_type:complete
MVIELIEVYKRDKMTEGKSEQSKYALREVFVNPEHVVFLREDTVYKKMLEEGHIKDMDNRQSFTKICMSRGQMEIDLVVVGPPNIVQEKLGLNKQQLLKG